jgi:chaperone modulatory protein CbpM
LVEHSQTVIIGTVVEEEVTYSFTELCERCALSHDELIAMVQEGMLQPRGETPEDWVFPGHTLRRLRAALLLQRRMEVNLPGVALALDLLDELRRLRAQVDALEHAFRSPQD